MRGHSLLIRLIMKTIHSEHLVLVSGGKIDKQKAAAHIKKEVKKFMREYGDDIARNVVGAIAVATVGTTLGSLFLVS